LREAVPTGIVPAHPSLAAFPSLAYTPPGFHWVNTYVRPLDGFGGIDEVALWFKRSRGAYAHNHPLSVYMTTAPRYPLVGTGGREGTVLPLIVAGAVVTATYFDGWWTPALDGEHVDSRGRRIHWDTSSVHSLVFALGSLTVGVRGSRRTNIDVPALVAVAGSLTS
jgi:hypothetical protein